MEFFEMNVESSLAAEAGCKWCMPKDDGCKFCWPVVQTKATKLQPTLVKPAATNLKIKR